jgi:AbrB family looped-hinge helix DNA binding protein
MVAILYLFNTSVNNVATTQMRSRITKKGQVTLPSPLRKKYHIEAGKSIEFKESDRGILLKPVQDIVDSAGTLSKFASSNDMIEELLESRKKPFR